MISLRLTEHISLLILDIFDVSALSSVSWRRVRPISSSINNSNLDIFMFIATNFVFGVTIQCFCLCLALVANMKSLSILSFSGSSYVSSVCIVFSDSFSYSLPSLTLELSSWFEGVLLELLIADFRSLYSPYQVMNR